MPASIPRPRRTYFTTAFVALLLRRKRPQDFLTFGFMTFEQVLRVVSRRPVSLQSSPLKSWVTLIQTSCRRTPKRLMSTNGLPSPNLKHLGKNAQNQRITIGSRSSDSSCTFPFPYLTGIINSRRKVSHPYGIALPKNLDVIHLLGD